MTEDQNIANRGPITAAIMLATLMNTLDSTIANVALPHIQGSLSASPDQVTWVLTSYIVMSAMVTPVAGWLSDRFGVKAVLLVAIVGFTAASMLCGIAANLGQIVLFRAAQGAFGASLIPLSQTVLLNINPPERHAQALALWAMGTILGPILGPVVGGYLTDEYSWRWCFYINLPIGLVALFGVWVFMSGEKRAAPRKFDFLGYGALAIALASLQLMLDRGPTLDWFSSVEIWAECLLALAAMWVFVTHTATARTPFFDPLLFTDRNLVTATAFSFFTAMLIFGSMAILPLLMQSLMGYPALTAGMVSVPRGLGMFGATMLAGRLGPSVDRRMVLLVGLLVMGLAMWQMTNFDLTMDAGPLEISGFLQGVGTGLFFASLTTLAFATIGPAQRPEASSFFNLVRNVGAAIGISIMQALAVANAQTMHASITAHVAPDDPAVRAGLNGALDTAGGVLALNGEITRQATMVAYLDDFRLMLWLCVLCVPFVMVLRPPRTRVLLEHVVVAD